MVVDICEYNEQYLNSLYEIHKTELLEQDQMSQTNFEDEFRQPTRKYFIAKVKNEVVGYIGLFDCDDDFTIMGIAVKNNFQNNGIASLLLDKAIKYAKENNKKTLSLEVDENNTNAINFYKNRKFVVTNIRKKYYKDNDALIMFYYL